MFTTLQLTSILIDIDYFLVNIGTKYSRLLTQIGQYR